MRRGTVVVLLGLLAIVSATSSAAADSRGHGRSGGHSGGGRSFHGHGHSFHHRAPSFHKHGFDRHRGLHRHRVVPRHFGGFGLLVAPPLVVYSPPLFDPAPYYSPPIYAPSVMYSPPPVTFSPPPVMHGVPPFAQAPPAPPLPRVVQHPTGRYELRGDGIGTPYTWVWIPNPPPAPPPANTPEGAPTSRDPLPTREQVYQWTDEQGVAHWTNRADRIPSRYREAATGS
jgi:hypothetical protein